MKLRRRHRNILRMIYKKKINLYLYAVTVEGFSINTIVNCKEELRLFSNYLQTPTVQFSHTMAAISLNNGIELADLQVFWATIIPQQLSVIQKYLKSENKMRKKKFLH